MIISKAKDRNGNTVAKIKGDCGRSFSIQTNGNLPEIHREFVWNGFDLSYNEDEVKAFLREHGTARQKEICGIQ